MEQNPRILSNQSWYAFFSVHFHVLQGKIYILQSSHNSEEMQELFSYLPSQPTIVSADSVDSRLHVTTSIEADNETPVPSSRQPKRVLQSGTKIHLQSSSRGSWIKN